ncbi:MAG: hypothetical protein A3H70_03530 [Candidatus Komeilibacteria bacterium RIFCSPLOWO2_02_FULL_48_11]|uniref:Uncharacterized protein n=1 Tax=Candidatus Komeilibacteria bacterium RIFCSPLOWO2_02_FULL_48_11 TaxID=1798553 RepID=A0A1G2BT93_9BACT|nr:MAG: hypothetical protein A3H70_03530 [Candidatus Komeilibacteria bacterium RIFCSPLOWO2_02_FULL_48_11]
MALLAGARTPLVQPRAGILTARPVNTCAITFVCRVTLIVRHPAVVLILVLAQADKSGVQVLPGAEAGAKCLRVQLQQELLVLRVNICVTGLVHQIAPLAVPLPGRQIQRVALAKANHGARLQAGELAGVKPVLVQLLHLARPGNICAMAPV